MGDGTLDLQEVWHRFAGGLFHGQTILDVGAGIGRSKDRLSINGNIVTTQDTERSFIEKVDLIIDTDKISGTWSVVTAFDVIEHSSSPDRFLKTLWRLAERAVFFTTPNAAKSPAPWHWHLDQLIKMCEPYITPIVSARIKTADAEWIELLSDDNRNAARAFGFLLEKESCVHF